MTNMLTIKLLVYFVTLSFTYFASSSLVAQSIVDTDSLAIVTVEINEPKTTTETDFKAVRETQSFLRTMLMNAGADVVRQHPRANAACNTCHTTGKLAIHTMAISESNPATTCGTCHNLEKAADMPFYVKGYASLVDTANLSEALTLLETSLDIRDNLNSYLKQNSQQKIPEGEIKLSTELAGRGQQKSAEDSSPFIEAKPLDLVPGAALAALSQSVFNLSDIGTTPPTVLEVKLEAKVQHAADLAAHLGLLTTLAPVLEPDGIEQITEVEIKDEYKPPLPVNTSLPLLQSLVTTHFSTAVVTKDETKSNERKYEWQVPGNPKTEIKFEWKNNDKTKIEFKKLLPANESAALAVLNGVQAQFSSNPAKRERKTKTEAKETLLKETKIALNYKPVALPLAALTLLKQQVETHLPQAVLKKQETNQIEWEIPGSPKGEIKAEIKDEAGKSESTIEFKKLAGNLHAASMLILANVQQAYPSIPSQFAHYTWKFEAREATQKATLVTALAALQDASAKGDFLFEVKHKADNKGTIPTPSELPELAQGYANASGDAIRRLRNELKFEKNQVLKEIKTNVVSASAEPIVLARVNSGDFNGDGRSDILLRDGNQLRIYFMSGASVLSQVATGTPLTADLQVDGVGDFNKDGRSDILLRDTANNNLMIRLMNGASVLSQVTLAVPPPAATVGVGDLNGDGRADLIFQNRKTGQVTVWLMTGASILARVAIGPNPNTWQVQAVRDTNGDGRADILFREGDQLRLWIMSGASILSQPNVGTPIPGMSVVAMGDLNGDGRADILLRNGNHLIVRLLSGASVLSQVTLATATTGLSTCGLGDFNGDKRADILHRNIGGALRMWMMSGASILSQATVSAGPPSTAVVVAQGPCIPTGIPH